MPQSPEDATPDSVYAASLDPANPPPAAALARAVREQNIASAARLLFTGTPANVDSDGYPLDTGRDSPSLLCLCYESTGPLPGQPQAVITIGNLLFACGASSRARPGHPESDLVRHFAGTDNTAALLAICSNGASPFPYLRAVLAGEAAFPSLSALGAIIAGASQCMALIDTLTDSCAGQVIYAGLALPDLVPILKTLHDRPECAPLRGPIDDLLLRAEPLLDKTLQSPTLIVRAILSLITDHKFSLIESLLQSNLLTSRQIFAILCNLPSPPALTVLCGWLSLFEGDDLVLITRDVILQQVRQRFFSF